MTYRQNLCCSVLVTSTGTAAALGRCVQGNKAPDWLWRVVSTSITEFTNTCTPSLTDQKSADTRRLTQLSKFYHQRIGWASPACSVAGASGCYGCLKQHTSTFIISFSSNGAGQISQAQGSTFMPAKSLQFVFQPWIALVFNKNAHVWSSRVWKLTLLMVWYENTLFLLCTHYIAGGKNYIP